MKIKAALIATLGLTAAAAFAGDAKTTVKTTTVTPSVSQSGTTAAGAATVLNNKKSKISYALGAALGGNMKKSGVEIDPSLFIKGFSDSYHGAGVLMTPAQVKSTMAMFQQEMMKKAEAKRAKVAAKQLSASQKFLNDNKTKPGVISLPDGLQYKVVTAGTGVKPKKSDTVVVNYEGKLIDGKVFDSSYARKKPATFKVADVIQGWQEALQLMKVGSTWEVYIPAKLAYGVQGIPGHIPPNSALIFKVNLVSIKK